MNKQTKMLIGVGVVAVAGYVYWKSTQKKSFANLGGNVFGKRADDTKGNCPCMYPRNSVLIGAYTGGNSNVPEGTWMTTCTIRPNGGANWKCYSNGPQSGAKINK